MKEIKIHQKLPNNWEDREKLRNKGQFWTPDWVADMMVEYVVEKSNLVFDPAAGTGAFYNALKKNRFHQQKINFYGIDIDKKVIKEGLDNGFYDRSLCTLEIRDFIFNPPKRKFKAIIANPPYIRHHRLPMTTKDKLKKIAKDIMGFSIDARAGLHIYFLIQALGLLDKDGKLAFIMPAGICEGIFAESLWGWITREYCLECVITFSPEATPFPNVDTNAIVFLITKKKPENQILWVVTKTAGSNDLKNFVKSKFKKFDFPSLEIKKRILDEALKTGLSRPPQKVNDIKYKFADFAKVMRGIATGANSFFLLTLKQAEELNIPREFLKPAIGRTRDVEGTYIDKKTLKGLNDKGRPTLLFSPDGRALEGFPEEVRNYLLYGEVLGLNKKPLIRTRNPWYKMEKRKIPPFLFAYLGRRNTRFIRNYAKVLPLTGFLCVYPRSQNKDFIEKLWQILKHSEIINNLQLVGKSYGGGAIKVEPRALEKLPIPIHLVEKYNLNSI